MSASDVLKLLVDENGDVDVATAREALAKRIKALQDDGVHLELAQTITLLQANVTQEILSLLRLLAQTQAGLIEVQRGFDSMITGAPTKVPPLDVERQGAALAAEFDLGRQARAYDMLSEIAGESDAEDS